MPNHDPGSREWLDQVKEEIIDPEREIVDPHHHLWRGGRWFDYMLEDLWTAAGERPSLMIYVHHDDAEREWAYDRESHIGRLDRGLDEAHSRGWTVISMKTDWNRIF